MKFSQLPLGQTFEFDGEDWIKVTPFVARCINSDKQKFMARYAVVKVASQGMATVAQEDKSQVKLRRVNSAFGAFYRECTDLLEESLANHPAEIRAAARQRLDDAQRRFHAALDAKP
jgi:hypothetical protein